MKWVGSYVFIISLFSILIYINRSIFKKPNSNMKDNFKTIGKIKFSLLDYLILISPFLLPFIFLGGKDEIGENRKSGNSELDFCL